MNPWRGLQSLPREIWFLCLAILINRALAIGPWLGTELLQKFGSHTVWIGTFVCGFLTAVMMWYLPGKGSDLSQPAEDYDDR